MKRNSFIALLAALFFVSCESSQQMNGLFMGSTLGGIFGSSIGGLMEGPRGADAGRAIGMLIGGAAGVAATAPRQSGDSEVNSNRGGTSSYSPDDEVDRYNRHGSGRTKQSKKQTDALVETMDLQIENLRFIDQNDNHILEASERAKIVFEVRNSGSKTLYNVTPVVSVIDNKRIMVSPTAIIGAIAPGKVVRYTAELYAKKSLREGKTEFAISFAHDNYLHTVRRFELSTGSRR